MRYRVLPFTLIWFIASFIFFQYMSTSPEQEPEYFEDHVRAALQVIFNHPKPHETLFPGDKAWRYKKQPDGTWLKQ